MLPLLNAIYSAFTSSGPFTSTFPGGLHRDQSPEGTQMPYLVSKVSESKLHYAFAGPYRSETRIRFSAYAVGHDAAASLANVVTSVLDGAVLSLSAGTHSGTTRLDEPIPTLHHHDAEGNDVWEWSVSYEFDVLL